MHCYVGEHVNLKISKGDLERLKALDDEGSKTVKQIGEHMKAGVGFENSLNKARMKKPGGIKAFVKMFSDFKVTEGMGQAVVTRKRFRRAQKSRP